MLDDNELLLRYPGPMDGMAACTNFYLRITKCFGFGILRAFRRFGASFTRYLILSIRFAGNVAVNLAPRSKRRINNKLMMKSFITRGRLPSLKIFLIVNRENAEHVL